MRECSRIRASAISAGAGDAAKARRTPSGTVVRVVARIGTTHMERMIPESEWDAGLRAFEVRAVLSGFGPARFGNALELGCGDGHGSAVLETFCRQLTATDFDPSKLRVNATAKTTFAALDAEDLSRFADGTFDLVFTSNLLEHVPQVDRCLHECARVLKIGGVAVHTVPNHTWKLFNLLLFYPACLAQRIRRPWRSAQSGRETGARAELDDNLRVAATSRAGLKRFLPAVHGCGKSHVDEWRRWRAQRWLDLFARSGMEVQRVIRLPFYFGFGCRFFGLLSLGNRLGLSSATGYVMARKRE